MKEQILWEPTQSSINSSNMMDFMNFINKEKNLSISNYKELYNWSVNYIDQFWLLFSSFSKLIFSKQASEVVDDPNLMPGACWFKDSKINFARNLLQFNDDSEAIVFYGEDRIREVLTYNELYKKVAKLSYSFTKMGVKKGDRVAALTANVPEAVVSMLAASSIGAIWSSCSPDFGIGSVVERFDQINPKVLIATNGYYYKGNKYSSYDKLNQILDKLDSVENVIIIEYVKFTSKQTLNRDYLNWDNLQTNSKELIDFCELPFNHPLYIMYSSGTTGKPKSIVHSSGGTLIQHLKELSLHTDIKRQDTVFYFTTCGWMMWNWLVSSLALGARILLFDGNVFYPKSEFLLKIADQEKVTVFGTSAKYISELEDRNVIPANVGKFDDLRVILSTGSPLVEENYDFIYSSWKSDVQLSSICGGTDIISCFFLGNPTLPVLRGKLQSIGLGMSVKSYGEDAKQVPFGEKGELICDKAFPSMPLYFWNDSKGEKYHDAYFATYDGVWKHGDYITIDENLSVEVHGRSDATLNPGGIRIGTSEIYKVLDKIDEIEDSLVIGWKHKSDEQIIFFLKMKGEFSIDDKFSEYLIGKVKKDCSPRHCPSRIIEVQRIPYTINGKKVEVAIKKIINGNMDYNIDAVSNPDIIDEYIDIYKKRFS